MKLALKVSSILLVTFLLAGGFGALCSIFNLGKAFAVIGGITIGFIGTLFAQTVLYRHE